MLSPISTPELIAPELIAPETNTSEPIPLKLGLTDVRPARAVQLNADLPAAITKAASKQTYYTIRFLVDRDRVLNAYRAYAYFRWLDDTLDDVLTSSAERIAFAERQQALIDCAFEGVNPPDATPEEQMLLALIASEPSQNGGLRLYIQHMMAIMCFDARRRDHLISAQELEDYTRHLATAVTEAMHYFIGHRCHSPQSDARYLAVMGAHVTHMLRDTYEDTAAGYFNVPREFLDRHDINARAVESAIKSDAYRAWVKRRVELARSYFEAGRVYLDQVESLRCRFAGYAYMARFESVLDTIERDGYRLRAAYLERKTLRGGLAMGWSASRMFIQSLLWGQA